MISGREARTIVTVLQEAIDYVAGYPDRPSPKAMLDNLQAALELAKKGIPPGPESPPDVRHLHNPVS